MIKTVNVGQINDNTANSLRNRLGVVDSNMLSRQSFVNFSGSTLDITTDSLPNIIDNVTLYVDGKLKIPETDYTINGDTITLTTPVSGLDISVLWFLDSSVYFDRNPSTITDLSAALVGRNSLMFYWSCGGAYANQGIVDKYVLYYSKQLITENNYTSCDSFEKTSGLGKYGTDTSMSLGGLDSNNIYYAVVVGYKDNRVSYISNVVEFKTESSYLPENLGGYIQMSDDQVIDHHKKVKVETISGETIYYTADRTVDGVVIEENNAPSSTLSDNSTPFVMSWTGYKKDWTNFAPYEIVYDLGEEKIITSVFVYLNFGTSLFTISTALLGEDYNVVYDGSVSYSDTNQWSRYDVDSVYQECRYVKLSFPSAIEIGEVAIFGTRLNDILPQGEKNINSIVKKPFEQFVGSNVFLTDNIEDWMKFGSTNRIYNNWQWFTSKAIAQSNDVRLTEAEGGTTIKYFFEDNRILGNIDDKLDVVKQIQLTDYGLSETVTMFNIKNGMQFQYLKSDGLSVEDWDVMSDYKTTDTAMYPEYSDHTNPMAWRFASQFAFAVSARYGRATGHDESLLCLSETNTPKQGLNLLKYIQWGNEPNKEWEGTEGYHSPQEYAAMMSAIYDGHKGTLGSGFGVKNADPTMKVVVPGLTGQNLAYIERAIHWWNTYRGVGDYPFDVFNLHYYHNTTGGQSSSVDRKGLSPDGINPVKIISEGGTYYDVMKYITDWRDKHLPNIEFWVGETGYDEHPNSPQSPEEQVGRALGLLKADFLMRTMLHMCAANVDGFTQYMYRNDTSLEEVISAGYTSIYITSGYVDNLTNAEPALPSNDINRYPPLSSYYYIISLMSLLKGMKFSHIIRISKKTYVQSIIKNINELDDETSNFCALAFEPNDGVDKKHAIVCWVGTEEDTTSTMEIKVDDVNVEVSTIRGSETTLSENGSTTTMSTNQVNGENILSASVNGTPIIVWSDTVGDVPLITPELDVITVDSTSARLYWVDKNLNTLDIDIYQYNDVSLDFDVIYSGEMLFQYYDITNLTPSTSYTYRIKFTNPLTDNESEYSNSISFVTPDVVEPPTNLQQTEIGYNRLTFSFDYDTDARDDIVGFIIYRSLEPTGTYTEIKRINSTLTEYTDYGLLEDTTYYYKIKAYSNLSTSIYSVIVSSTTLESNLLPPTLYSAKTSYSGDRISLFFDLPMSSSMSFLGNMTIYESGVTGTTITYPIKLPVSVEFDSTENRVGIYLDNPIESELSDIRIGYDGNGILNSSWGIGVESFEDFTVTNNVNSESLVSETIYVTYNGDSDLDVKYEENNVPVDSLWNMFVITSGTEYTGNLENSDNNTSEVTTSSVRMSQPSSSIPQGPTKRVISDDTGTFPSWVKSSGINITEYLPTDTRVRLVFHNLNPKLKYNFELFASRVFNTDISNLEVYANFGDTPLSSKNVTSNYNESIFINGITPTSDTYTTPTDGVVIPGWALPKIFIDLKILEDGNKQSCTLGGIILREITNESN